MRHVFIYVMPSEARLENFWGVNAKQSLKLFVVNLFLKIFLAFVKFICLNRKFRK